MRSARILELKPRWRGGTTIHAVGGTLVGRLRFEPATDTRPHRTVVTTPQGELVWLIEPVRDEQHPTGTLVLTADERPLGTVALPLIFDNDDEPIARLKDVSRKHNARTDFRVTSEDGKPVATPWASITLNRKATSARIELFTMAPSILRPLIVTAAWDQRAAVAAERHDDA